MHVASPLPHQLGAQAYRCLGVGETGMRKKHHHLQYQIVFIKSTVKYVLIVYLFGMIDVNISIFLQTL